MHMGGVDQSRLDSEAVRFRFRERMTGILFLSGIFFFNFLARCIWSPLLVDIESDLHIRHAEAGSLFLFITMGYFIGLISSGHISSRLTHQKTAVLSSYVCSVAVIAAMAAPNLKVLYLCLGAIGFTAGLYLPSGIASLTYRLEVRDFGKAFGFHEVAPSLGFVAGPLLAETLLGWHSWRGVLLPVAVGLFGVGLAYHMGNWTGDFRGEPLSIRNAKYVGGNSVFWLMSIPFMLAIGANFGVFNMLPLYLQTERGMDQSVVNWMLSLSRVGAMICVILIGWIMARFSLKSIVIFIFLFTGVFTALLGVLPTRWLWIPIFIQPILSAAFFPPAFSILSQVFPPQFRSLMVSLIISMGILVGGGFLPTMIGGFGDAGMFHMGFMITGGMIVIGTGILLWMRAPGKPR